MNDIEALRLLHEGARLRLFWWDANYYIFRMKVDGNWMFVDSNGNPYSFPAHGLADEDGEWETHLHVYGYQR